MILQAAASARRLAGSPSCPPKSCEPPRAARAPRATAGSTKRDRSMRMLLTNDDGPDSPFLRTFLAIARQSPLWDVTVCVPADNQSFVAKALPRGPLALAEAEPGFFTVTGTPAAAANIAIHQLADPHPFDLVVSGPNIGHNAGRAFVLSSGTVGAAAEAALLGLPAIALSFPFFQGLHRWTDAQVHVASAAALAAVERLWSQWPAGADLCNVNVPLGVGAVDVDVPALLGAEPIRPDDTAFEWLPVPGLSAPVPLAWTRIAGGRGYGRAYAQDKDGLFAWSPEGLRVFERPAEAGTDVWAIRMGAVSVTPLGASLREA